jgi:hypothetical protein
LRRADLAEVCNQDTAAGFVRPTALRLKLAERAERKKSSAGE